MVKKKEPIIEEIDTTIPKDNNEEKGNNEEDEAEDENDPKKGKLIVKVINANTVCHRIIPKGTDIDITTKTFFNCYKIKTKSNIISFITGSKKIKVPYLIFFDENFYYMIKDKVVNKNNENIRRIGNRYDLLKITNFQARKVNDDYEFAFEFMNEDYFDRTYKLLYFEPKEAEIFHEVFQHFAYSFGVDICGTLLNNMEEEEEEDEAEEGEEEEDQTEEKEENDIMDNKEDKMDENNNKNENNDEEEDEKGKKNSKENIDNFENNESISTKDKSNEIKESEVDK